MRKKQLAAAFFACVLLTGTYAAAQETETEESFYRGAEVAILPGELLDQVEDAMEDVRSVSSELSLALNFALEMGGGDSGESVQMDMSLNVEMLSDQLLEPWQGYSLTTISSNLLGMSLDEVQESYLREEKGEKVIYTGTQKNGEVVEWKRYTEDGIAGEADDLYGSVAMDGLYDSAEDLLDDLEDMEALEVLDQKVVDEDGTEYYVLEGILDLTDESEAAEEITELLDELEAFLGSIAIELPERVYVSAYIGTEDWFLYGISADLSGIRGSMNTGSSAVSLDVSGLVLNLTLGNYNNVDPIKFPEELDSAKTVR